LQDQTLFVLDNLADFVHYWGIEIT